MRICETLATQTKINLGSNNNNYVPCNNIRCIFWCVSEVQGGGKITVQLSVVIYEKYGVFYWDAS